MTKKLHKLFTLFLAVAVFFTYLPAASMLGADTNAYAASYAGTLKQHDTGQKLSGKTVEIWVARATSNTKLENVELKYGPCVEAADGGSFHKYEIDTGKKDILVYCVEHGVVQRSDKLKSVEEKNSYYAKAYEKDGHAQSIENMKKVLMFSPTTGSDFGELRDLGYTGSGNLNDWIAASQALIWECGQLMREDKNFTLTASGLYYRSSYQGERTKKIPKTHYYNCLDKTAQAIYKFMVREIKKYEHFDASIASTDKSKPKQLAIAEDATFPVTLEIASGSYGDDLYLAEETESGKVKKLSSKIAELKYDKTKKTYSIVVKTEEALNKTSSLLTQERKTQIIANIKNLKCGFRDRRLIKNAWLFIQKIDAVLLVKARKRIVDFFFCVSLPAKDRDEVVHRHIKSLVSIFSVNDA